jgi:hypothetical protein
MSDGFTDFGTGIGNMFEGIGNGISQAFSPFTNLFQPIAEPIGNVVGTVGEGASGFIGQGFNNATRISKGVGDTVEGLGSFLSSPISYVIIGVLAIIILPKVL